MRNIFRQAAKQIPVIKSVKVAEKLPKLARDEFAGFIVLYARAPPFD